MSIRDCKLVAVDGSHGSGKTTLVAGIVAALKARHVHAASLPEVARKSPFLEDAIFRDVEYDAVLEAHLFATQIAEELLTSRHHEVLLCDRTLVNVVAYAEALLGDAVPATRQLIGAMRNFAKPYARFYDRIFLLVDTYDPTLTRDPFRPHDRTLQHDIHKQLLECYAELDIPVWPVPHGLSLQDRVDWTLERILPIL